MSSKGLNSKLSQCVYQEVKTYLSYIKDSEVTDVYNMVVSEVEKALLSLVLETTKGNQSKAAKMLGLNRATLRKKLVACQLVE